MLIWKAGTQDYDRGKEKPAQITSCMISTYFYRVEGSMESPSLLKHYFFRALFSVFRIYSLCEFSAW